MWRESDAVVNIMLIWIRHHDEFTENGIQN